MDFGLSQEQELLQQALRGYLAERVPTTRVRTVMESESGHDHELLLGLAVQGVTGVLIPERFGGSGLGLLDALVIAEELGRAATPCSFHTTAVMAPLLLAAAGSRQQQGRWLPALASGKALVSVALDAALACNGVLNGTALFVADGAVADAFLICTSSADQAELYLLPRRTPGLHCRELPAVDMTRRLGELSFTDLRLTPEMLMPADNVAELLARVFDAGRIVLAADALGAATRSLEEAVAYSHTRQQFGRPVGSFQAVKHMCAETAAEIEPLRSLLWYAAFAWDEQRADAAQVAALCKAHACEVASRAVDTTVQVFGGMGFTWDCDMQLWYKRAGYDRQLLGNPVEMRRAAAEHGSRASAGQSAGEAGGSNPSAGEAGGSSA